MVHGRDIDLPDRLVLNIGIGATESQQSEQMGLARAVIAQHRDPLSVPNLKVEGLGQVR